MNRFNGKGIMTRLLAFSLFSILASLTISACSNNPSKQSATPAVSNSLDSASQPATGWVTFAVRTATSTTAPSQVNHNDYLAGPHAKFKCDDCHSITRTDPTTKLASYVPREKICVYCHPLSKYSSVMTDADHIALGAGTRCNGCHYSASGISGSAISGWNWSSNSPRTRVVSTLWHKDIKGACANCHTPSAVPNYPANHYPTGCETCHTYGNGSWSGGKGHVSATSGCAACHPAQAHTIAGSSIIGGTMFSGVDCSTCHQPSVAASYANWLGAPGGGFHSNITGACANCHVPLSIPAYPSGHYTTGCESCHNYNNGSWKSTATHPAVTSSCITCHSALPHTIAGSSISSGSVFSGVDCSTCHQPSVAASYANWLGAPGGGFHSNITGACANCHTPSAVAAYPAGHYTTGCETCHTYNNGSWKSTAGHPAVTSACANCHSAKSHSITGSSITAGTMFSGVDCSVCHQPSVTATYANWLGAPGGGFHANITGACLNCHTASNTPSYPSGHNTANCENCHAYNGGSWKFAHAKAITGCAAANCHATQTHLTIVSGTLSSPETFAGTGCENCHSASITAGYANWLGGTHMSSPGTCATCHATHTHTTLVGNPSVTIANGSTFGQFSGVGCQSCHAASAPGYTSWLGAGAGALHISPQPACQTCHQHHNNTQLCTKCHSSSLVKWNQP